MLPLLLLAIASQGLCQNVPTPKFKLMAGGGLRVEVPDVSGMTQVDLHFSINKPVTGVSAADYNIEIRSATGGLWVYEDASIPVKAGDTINFWILVFINGGGYQNTDQSGTVEGGEAPTTTTQGTTTTKATTTKAPTTTTQTTTPTTTTPAGPPLPKAHLMYMEPGLRMWVEDEEGLQHVGFHFNINEVLNGIDFGQENVEIDKVGADGAWSHMWPDVELNKGDTIYYWYYLVIDKKGYQITDQSFTYGETIPVGTTTTQQPGTTIPSILSVTESNLGHYFAPGQLIFEDEFDEIDKDIWQSEITMGGGGNWEFQMYTHNISNCYTRDSILYMKPTLTEDTYGREFLTSGTLDLWSGQPGSWCTCHSFYGCFRVGTSTNMLNPIMSSRLRSSRGFTFMYGKVEVKAKLPLGDWLWPAIWLLPKRSKYGQWPASGEIDIMESRGNADLTMNGVNIGVEQFGSTLQYGGGYPINGYEKAHCDYNTPPGQGLHLDYHTYGLDWTPTYLAFSFDGVEFCKIEPPSPGGFWEHGGWHETDMDNPWAGARNPVIAPFDEQYFLVLNVAVGGTGGYFPDTASSGSGKPWSNESPTAPAEFYNAKDTWYKTWNPEENNGEGAAMAIDYIRVWASDVIKE